MKCQSYIQRFRGKVAIRNFLLSENRKLIDDLLIQSISLKAITPIITVVVSTYTPAQTSLKRHDQSIEVAQAIGCNTTAI